MSGHGRASRRPAGWGLWKNGLLIFVNILQHFPFILNDNMRSISILHSLLHFFGQMYPCFWSTLAGRQCTGDEYGGVPNPEDDCNTCKCVNGCIAGGCTLKGCDDGNVLKLLVIIEQHRITALLYSVNTFKFDYQSMRHPILLKWIR